MRLGAFRAGWHKLGTGASAARYKTGGIHWADVALVVSGMGEDRAYAAAKRTLAALKPRAYLSVGFSGALRGNLRPGDLVIGESAASPGRGRAAVYRAAPSLLKAALDGLQDTVVFTGGLVTVPRTLVTAEEKREYDGGGIRGGGEVADVRPAPVPFLAADMESAGCARAAYEDGVPFIAIRAISDTLYEDMPVDFNRFIRDGRLDYPRFILHVITHPGAIPGLMRLGRNSTLAAENLAEAVGRIVANI